MSAAIRLQKLLSAAGVSSRRAAERLMSSGRVTVNGKVVTTLGTKADPAADDVRVDGYRVTRSVRRRYVLLRKPRGYVTTRSDPEGRRTVLDLVKRVRDYVYPVGRLDYESEGLLLLTNDGELAARLTHPRYGVTGGIRQTSSPACNTVSGSAYSALTATTICTSGGAKLGKWRRTSLVRSATVAP